MMEVHLESKMQPQVRQWCFLRTTLNTAPHEKHSLQISSAIQNSLAEDLLLHLLEPGIDLLGGSFAQNSTR